jgi:hypothetical protein
MRSSTAMLACVGSASLASVVALAPGCGGSVGGGDGGSIALANFASEYAKAFCRRVYTCCDDVERAAMPDWGATEADCVRAATATLSATNLLAAVDEGRIVYHGDRARRCLDNIAALSCADWGVGFVMRYIPECPQIAEGMGAEGAPCTLQEECASRYCSGTCLARSGAGEPCSGPFSCQDGLYCSLSDGTCAAILPIGATSCTENPACQNYSCPPPAGSEPRTCIPATCNGV